MTEQEKMIELWDAYAMEFFKARVSEGWPPQNLAEAAYRYATAMMREREVQLTVGQK